MVTKFGAALAAAALLCAAGAAEGAQFVTVDQSSGVFGFNNVTAGAFSHKFEFAWPAAGISSATLTSIRVTPLTDLSFSKVRLNGVDFEVNVSGQVEYRSLNRMTVTGGDQTLIVEGRSGGNGSYAGVLAFSPEDTSGAGPVPEPATWGLMIGGLGLVGGALRRRTAVTA